MISSHEKHMLECFLDAVSTESQTLAVAPSSFSFQVKALCANSHAIHTSFILLHY